MTLIIPANNTFLLYIQIRHKLYLEFREREFLKQLDVRTHSCEISDIIDFAFCLEFSVKMFRIKDLMSPLVSNLSTISDKMLC